MPSERRDGIDVARVVALLVVVVGHLTLAVVDRHGGTVRGANLLQLHPRYAWVAAAAPMPVFFAAAGWANAHASPDAAAPRLRTLVGVATVVVVAWSLAVGVADLVAGPPGVVGDGARVATQPAWFLAAYVPFAAAGGVLGRLAATRPPALTMGTCLAVLAALDAARFVFHAPEWIGWPGFYLAWGVPWLAGAWWRSRYCAGMRERRVGVALLVGAGLAAAAGVRWFGYAPALIDAVPGRRSNTTPPTLYTAVVALAQVGALMLAASALDRAGQRWRSLWDRAGEAAVGVYLWHLTALALCAGVVALGVPVPERLSAAWWLTRPLWWAAVILVALGFVVATDAVRARLRRRSAARGVPARSRLMLGVTLTAAGAGLVGLRGPRTIAVAVASSMLFVAAWASLRGSGEAQAGSGPRTRRDTE